MSVEKNKNEDPLHTDNIFDDLWSEDISVNTEQIELLDAKTEKYKKYGTLLARVNILFLLIISLVWSYIFIQNRAFDLNIFSAYCSPFIWNVEIDKWCKSITKYLDIYDEEIKKKKHLYTHSVAKVFEKKYSIDNFWESKDVSFLLDVSESKTDVVKILTEFDKIKNSFTSVDKLSVKCSSIELKKWNLLSVSCDVYSYVWDNERWGTSITIAAKLQEELDWSPNFEVLKKQKVFSSERVSGDSFYTQKTTIVLDLKYIDTDSINL